MYIPYCSGPCGSGKSFALVERAIPMANGGKIVVLVQPTIDLIKQTIADELLQRPNPPKYREFHSESVAQGTSVAASLAEYLQCYADGGEILFTTHQVIQHMFWPVNKRDIHLLFDECLQVAQSKKYKVPHSHRFIIPTVSIMPGEMYDPITANIKAAIEHAGYSTGSANKNKSSLPPSGLDISKLGQSSLFAAPAQAQVKEASFFYIFDGSNRHYLNPETWIKNSLVPLVPEPSFNLPWQGPLTVDSNAVDEAIAVWHSAPLGHGSEAFFHLGVQLAIAGMPLHEIEGLLREQSQFARPHSKNDRLKQVPSVIKSLSRHPAQKRLRETQ